MNEMTDKPKGKGGRPPAWTPERAAEAKDLIVNGLTAGRSLASIIAAEGMPSATQVFRWIRDDEQFREDYTRARDESGDVLEAQLQDVTEQVKAGTLDPAAARVVSDNLKWIAAKRKPKVYGDVKDKTDVSVTLSLQDMHLHAVRQPELVDVTPRTQPVMIEAQDVSPKTPSN